MGPEFPQYTVAPQKGAGEGGGGRCLCQSAAEIPMSCPPHRGWCSQTSESWSLLGNLEVPGKLQVCCRGLTKTVCLHNHFQTLPVVQASGLKKGSF